MSFAPPSGSLLLPGGMLSGTDGDYWTLHAMECAGQLEHGDLDLNCNSKGITDFPEDHL